MLLHEMCTTEDCQYLPPRTLPVTYKKLTVYVVLLGGAWLVAYKAEQRRRFKAVLCRDSDVALPGKSSVSKSSLKSDKTSEDEKRTKLDGFYLVHIN